jgi:hypothetical protein
VDEGLARRTMWKRKMSQTKCKKLHERLIAEEPDTSSFGNVIKGLVASFRCLGFEAI